MKNKLSIWLARGLTGLRALGPYAMIELIVPGGTVIAVLLWLYRRHTRVVLGTQQHS
jgi:hypothetical protein